MHKRFNRRLLNMWEEAGLKGNIPCRVSILALTFECKLIPKGNGKYLIPVTKKTLSALDSEIVGNDPCIVPRIDENVGNDPCIVPRNEYEITMEPLETLSRINHDSPYSKEHPIRKIDGIETIPIQAGFCGHCCVAMLAGVPLSDAVALMGKAHASWSKILEALDYYGISYASKAVYTKGGSYKLPMCCIVNNDNIFILWYKGSFCGVTGVDPKKTISYIEIFVD